MKKYFSTAIMFTAICLLTVLLTQGFQSLFLTAILGVIELSLSFDNAIVNAGILEKMPEIWRKRFLTWGIIIAVFGMRFALPILIVYLSSNLSILNTITIAFTNPLQYAGLLTKAHTGIMGFGGNFLMLIALHYFIDEEKDIFWWKWLEQKALKLTRFGCIQPLIVTFVYLIMQCFLGFSTQFAIGSFAGISLYYIIKLIGNNLNIKDASIIIAKAGIMGFLYLEILDASFSFDGVISSFIITNNIIIIALGLGIGAMFIRSLTLLLVDKRVLTEYRYLETGAFYSILWLSVTSFLSIYINISTVGVGITSVSIIMLALISSVNYNRNLNFKGKNMLNLSKGENLNLSKEHATVTKYRVGLGWKAADSGSNSYDLDGSVCLLNADHKLMGDEFVCYFRQKDIPGVHHHGDNLTGGTGTSDDEQIDINLAALPANTSEAVLFVNIYQAIEKRQNFGQVSNAYIQLYNAETNEVLARYNLEEEFASATLVHFGSIKKTEAGDWVFKAVGVGKTMNINEFVRSLA